MASGFSSVNHGLGIKEEEQLQVSREIHHQSSLAELEVVSLEGQSSEATVKKRRNLPGNSYPDAEVIALSPKSLLATNRFMCEVCNKGFQREQNLQLHRRGHNLPWKLKQKNPNAVRRRVYLCPEPTCVHHDPSRALGDLTGVKKHFCRKHGEKKFKCEKCSKLYAVQSDWKAHSKTCGTREYRCECGTLFSRRDSFVTHRAFCEALTQDTKFQNLGHHLYNNNNNIPMSLSQLSSRFTSQQDQTQHSNPTSLLNLSAAASTYQFNHLIPQPSNAFRGLQPATPLTPSFYSSALSNHNINPHDQQSQNDRLHGLMQASASAGVGAFNLNFFSNNNTTTDVMSNANGAAMINAGDLYNNSNGSTERMMLFTGNPRTDTEFQSVFSSSNVHMPQISATALLQKAAQVGSTTSERSSYILQGIMGSSTSKEVADHFYSSSPNANDPGFRTQLESDNNLQCLMNSLANGSTSGLLGGMTAGFTGNCTTNGGGKEDNGGFGTAFNSGLIYNLDEGDNVGSLKTNGGLGVSDGLTRDFLGVGGIVRSMHGGAIPQQDVDALQTDGIHMMSSLDTEVKSSEYSSSTPYSTSCASLQ